MRRIRSTCASAQSNKRLRWPPEDALYPWLLTACLAKTDQPVRISSAGRSCTCSIVENAVLSYIFTFRLGIVWGNAKWSHSLIKSSLFYTSICSVVCNDYTSEGRCDSCSGIVLRCSYCHFEYLAFCFTSWLRVKLADRKSALTPPPPHPPRPPATTTTTNPRCCFVVYSTRRFVLCLITSLGEVRAKLSVFRTFVWFALVLFCLFPLTHGVWEGLRFVTVALPGLFSYLFF